MKYKLSDLIDLPKLQNLMDAFLSTTGTVSAIFDAEGNMLIRSNWSTICEEFHRSNPKTKMRCSESGASILRHIGGDKSGEVTTYRCKNGLMDAASLLFIDGEYIGTIFIGQFLLERPDVEYFRNQARECGFDEAAYLKALAEVPVIPEENVAPIARYLKQLTEFLADIGLKELKRLEGEKALRESEERFRAIADYTYDWENWIGPGGKLLWVNPAVERITGYSVDECLAMPDFPLPLVDEADREVAADKIRGAIQGASENDFELRVRRKDGHPVWVAASWQPIYDPRGAGLGHRSSLRDITERKRMEEALKQSEERFRLLVQQVKDYAIFSLDAEGRAASWSLGAERIYGYRAKEIVGEHLSVLHASTAIDLREPWRILEVAAAEGQFKGEGWRIRKNGSLFWADVVITALRDEAGNLQGFTNVTRNIDERRKTEEALNYRLAMEELVVSISNRFINLGSDEMESETTRALEEVRKFTGADRCYLSLLSMDRKMVARVYESCAEGIKPLRQKLLDFSLEPLPWLFKKLSRMETVSIFDVTDFPPEAEAEREHWRNNSMLTEVIFPLSSGKSLTGYFVLSSDPEGKVWTPEDLGLVRLVGETLRNTFERIQSEAERRRLGEEVLEGQRKEMEARLRVNERMAALGAMVSGIAHDIRNPINFVSLALDHLSDKKQRGKRKEHEIRDLFADAHSELVRVNEMIQGLLDYGRSHASKLEVENASEILVESRNEIIRQHPNEERCISLEGVDDAFPILADRHHLFRALVNLLENALEAGGPEGLVRAGLGYQTKNKSGILLWVEDSGPGIAEENLAKIFTPYFTTNKSGVGLGLTLTQKWVNEMGGKIQVYNMPRGGARFELSFPVADTDNRVRVKGRTKRPALMHLDGIVSTA